MNFFPTDAQQKMAFWFILCQINYKVRSALSFVLLHHIYLSIYLSISLSIYLSLYLFTYCLERKSNIDRSIFPKNNYIFHGVY